ncbi:unnamed protein product [Allacma fusca]|uniref:Uncharacterized protein n=1 Tax=Allacma fusca TaxID=39272 RepID=A0A8J2JGB8_9HEXA|nr:unnamed protein product [Allacma fusca]
MLSSEALEEYRKVIKYGWRLGVIPYAWNNKEGRVEHRGSRGCRLFWNMQFGLYCLYESFLMFRWLWALADTRSSGPERAVNLQYVTWGGMFLVSQHFSTWTNYGQHHTMINQFLDHFQQFQQKHHRIVGKLQGKGKKPECAGFMKKHDLGGRTRLERMPSHPFVLLREFRSLQLLQSHFNQLFKAYLAQLQLLFIITITLGYFAGSSLSGARAFQTTVLATMFLLIFITMWNYLAEVNVRSSSALLSWQVSRGLPEMRQFLASFLPFSTHIGDFLIADKSLVLVSVATIIDSTTTLLLNVKYS